MSKLYNRNKQSKNITEDWKYIRRSNDIERGLSKSARHILSSALYQINKYEHAVLTHYELSQITEVKNDQNCNLIKQLGFVLDFQFKRSVVINEKKYRDCYIFTKNENTDKILENPEEYFTNLQQKNLVTSPKKFGSNGIKECRKNSVASQKKFSDIAEKVQRSQEALHIYNKNKEKIDKKYYLENLSSNSIEKTVENAECKIANYECVENSHCGLAKEEFVQSTEAKISTKEDVVAYAPKKQNIPPDNQKGSNNEQDIGDYYPMLLKNFPLTDRVIEEVLHYSNKQNYTIGKVRLIVRNILDSSPTKPVYGGKSGLVKYLVQAVNNHVEYDNSDYTTNIFQKKNLTKEEQDIVNKSWSENKITWAPC